MDGLVVGRNIHYVTGDDVHHAAFVTWVWNKASGVINLSYLHNGASDTTVGLTESVVRKTSVTYNKDGAPNTWHWIESDPPKEEVAQVVTTVFTSYPPVQLPPYHQVPELPKHDHPNQPKHPVTPANVHADEQANRDPQVDRAEPNPPGKAKGRNKE
jgi:hypothetical protein